MNLRKIVQRLATIACMTAGVAAISRAQISPGPLSRAHQSLAGATNCSTCHRLGGGQPTFRCLDCHTEIAARIAQHKGLHAQYRIEPGSSQECARCHSEHNGLDFPVIKWDPKTFNHQQTGYPLEGKHAGLACNRCHTADKVSAAERPAIKVRDLSRSFLGIPKTCTTCHQDEHKGRLGPNCQQCHGFESWKAVNVGQFDHSKTRYPLTGLHTQVACLKCHTPGSDHKPAYTGIAFSQCTDCHRDPHRGSFVQTCQSCHNTGGWKKIALQTVNERFDHSKTKFPLVAKHLSVDCVQCHANGDFKKPLAFQKCADCHRPNPHGEQFAKRPEGGECSSCHTVEGWKPSTFSVKSHAATAYPLQGKHAVVACSQCHIPKGKDTLFKVNFQRCTDCHSDRHAGQFAGAPYFNACDRCHTLEGYKPSTFTLALHKTSRFQLTNGHIAVPCGECHKESAESQPKTITYHWVDLNCASCHADPHKGQFKDRMQQKLPEGKIAGCEACHTTKSWKELSGFDHSKTAFVLTGTHRGTACIDCHKPSNLETGLANVDFKAAPGKCEDCHQDVHARQFAQGESTPCATCHNTAKWKPSLFDHDKRTVFPLQGLHRNVQCRACHKLFRNVDGNSVLFYKPTPKECEACHGSGVTDSKRPK